MSSFPYVNTPQITSETQVQVKWHNSELYTPDYHHYDQKALEDVRNALSELEADFKMEQEAQEGIRCDGYDSCPTRNAQNCASDCHRIIFAVCPEACFKS